MNVRDALLAKLAAIVEPVEIDGVTVYLRPISYATQLKIADMQLGSGEVSPAKIAEFQRLTVMDCVCDEKGLPVFDDENWEQVKRSDGKFLIALWKVINERQGGVEAEAGNASGAAPSAESASNSPSPSAAGQATSIDAP